MDGCTSAFTWAASRREGGDPLDAVEKRIRRALDAAQKFSLVANSVKSEVAVEPDIVIESGRL